MAGTGSDEEDGARVTSRPYGRVQIVKSGRKLFGAARQKVFLAHLAATCNVTRSAAAAGVTVECVYQRRMKDARFREGWAQALEQGYARLEAMLLERAAAAQPIEIDGGLIVDEAPVDKDLALFLLREHKKGLSGLPRPGAAPRAADWSEVEAYFIGKLRALKGRLEAETAALPAPPERSEEEGDAPR